MTTWTRKMLTLQNGAAILRQLSGSGGQENVECCTAHSVMPELLQWAQRGCQGSSLYMRRKDRGDHKAVQKWWVMASPSSSGCRTDPGGLLPSKAESSLLGTAGSAHADPLVGASWQKAGGVMGYWGPSLQFIMKAVSWSKGPALPSLASLPLKSPPATVPLMIFVTGRESTIVCLVCFRNRLLNLQMTVCCVSEIGCPGVYQSTSNRKRGTSLWRHAKWQH